MLGDMHIHAINVHLHVYMRQEDKDDNIANTGLNSLHINKNYMSNTIA